MVDKAVANLEVAVAVGLGLPDPSTIPGDHKKALVADKEEVSEVG